jgi:hypothetical protein
VDDCADQLDLSRQAKQKYRSTTEYDESYTPHHLPFIYKCTVGILRKDLKHKTTIHHRHGRASDSNLPPSWLGDARIDPGRTAQLSMPPILVRPALWILTQASLIFVRTTLLLWRRFLVLACMPNCRSLGPAKVCRFSG